MKILFFLSLIELTLKKQKNRSVMIRGRINGRKRIGLLKPEKSNSVILKNCVAASFDTIVRMNIVPKKEAGKITYKLISADRSIIFALSSVGGLNGEIRKSEIENVISFGDA